MTDYELISFCVTCYNQEKYIKESIQSVLNQDYPNLEIIISDDCSTDNTYGIINELLNNYKGNHKVFLLRNKTNLGISENRNIVLKKATGKWIISQDGDDISVLNRASIIAQYIKNKSVSAIYTSTYSINQIGKGIKKIPINLTLGSQLVLSGSNASYSKKVIDGFMPLNSNAMDDTTLLFRSLIIGSILILDSPTVYDRENSDFKYYLRKRLKYLYLVLNSYNQRQNDLLNYRDKLDHKIFKFLEKHNVRHINELTNYLKSSRFESEVYLDKIYFTKNKLTQFALIYKMKETNIIKKAKIFLLTFLPFRNLSIIIKNRNKHSKFSNKFKIISIDDLISEKYIIDTINDFKFNDYAHN